MNRLLSSIKKRKRTILGTWHIAIYEFSMTWDDIVSKGDPGNEVTSELRGLYSEYSIGSSS